MTCAALRAPLATLAHVPESRQTREQAAELQSNLARSLFSRGQFERAKETFLLAEPRYRNSLNLVLPIRQPAWQNANTENSYNH